LEAVFLPNPTIGALILGQVLPLDPQKSKDFLRSDRKHRAAKIPRVKHRSVYEFSP